MAFPLAGRPDIIRANQKVITECIDAVEESLSFQKQPQRSNCLQDENYKSQTLEVLQDATRRLFGPRQAILWLR